MRYYNNLDQGERIFCKKCIIPEGFIGIELNSQGECNFCYDQSYKNNNYSKLIIPKKLKQEKVKDWENIIKEVRDHQEEGKYDCLLGYSGGKDSTALLDMLINKYRLKPFVITIETGLMTDVAKNNIKKTLEKLDYSNNHIFINYAIPTFLNLYKFLFTQHDSKEELLTKRICDRCSDLMHSIMVKEALKRDLNICILGYSPDQIRRYFYEISKKEIRKKWMPEFLEHVFLDDKDRDCYVSEEDFQGKKIPRIILPFHVLPYDEEKIIREVVDKELIEKGKTNPVLTNCHTVKTAIVFDYKNYGWISYSLQYAELIRQIEDSNERKKARKKWLKLCKIIEKQIQSGTFNKQGIEYFIKKTNISHDKIFPR